MREIQMKVEARKPNWLPIPGVITAGEKRSALVDENDFFRKGEVVSYQPMQRHGVIENEQGERVPFDLHQIDVLGDAAYIEAGVRVGYDVSRTSSGNRVTCLKVY